jgi:hypothetical protein
LLAAEGKGGKSLSEMDIGEYRRIPLLMDIILILIYRG